MKKILISLILCLILVACQNNKDTKIQEIKEIADRTYEIIDEYTFNFKDYNDEIYSAFFIAMEDNKIFVDIHAPNERYYAIKDKMNDHTAYYGLYDTLEIGYIDWNDKTYHTIKNFKDDKVVVPTIATYKDAYLYGVLDLDSNKDHNNIIKFYYVKDGVEKLIDQGLTSPNYVPEFTRFKNKLAFFVPNAIGKDLGVGHIGIFDLETGEYRIIKEYMTDDQNHQNKELLVQNYITKSKNGFYYTTYIDTDRSMKIYHIDYETEEIRPVENVPISRVGRFYETDDFQLARYMDEDDFWGYAIAYNDGKQTKIIDLYEEFIYHDNLGKPIIDNNIMYVKSADHIDELSFKNNKINRKIIVDKNPNDYVPLRIYGMNNKGNLIYESDEDNKFHILTLKELKINRFLEGE